MKRAVLTILIIGLSGCSQANVEPYEFEGDNLGSLKSQSLHKENWTEKYENEYSIDSSTVAGVPAESHLQSYHDDKLWRIKFIFKPGSYQAVRDAMQARYGNPHKSAAKSCLWDNGVSTIELLEFAGEVKLEFTYVKFRDEFMAKAKEARGR